ncbi:MAG: iron ABC transporter permease [Candidatus Bacteroides intestinipullorum]|uniref:Iron ABC transporter permease n=1 Tax=Candidatus Bacteroides intestinipullorum TaxID=2838471 RepID=A0A9E2KEY4_9BACE|nr:iron ABC transporter permease [Candidatus Bacteroides intestinipullorum]
MNKTGRHILLLGVLIVLLFVANLLVGSVSIPADEVFRILLGEDTGRASWRYIVWEARLPQALTAMLAGSALAACGLLLQTAFRNPLAGVSILGVNSGAGLGVAVVMLLLGGTLSAGAFSLSGFFSVLAGAFAGALAVMALILFFSTVVRSNVMLLIIGLMVGYLVSSVVSLLNFMSTAEGVQSYMVWGMGHFGGVSLRQMPAFAAVVLAGLAGALLLVKPLNALLLGERYAENLGVRVRRVRHVLLVVVGVLTAVTTAFCGPVLFIDLAVPHIARLLLPTANHRLLLPATMLAGAVVALACNLACVLPGGAGLIPLNAVTPLIGAPIVIYVIVRQRTLG